MHAVYRCMQFSSTFTLWNILWNLFKQVNNRNNKWLLNSWFSVYAHFQKHILIAYPEDFFFLKKPSPSCKAIWIGHGNPFDPRPSFAVQGRACEWVVNEDACAGCSAQPTLPPLRAAVDDIPLLFTPQRDQLWKGAARKSTEVWKEFREMKLWLKAKKTRPLRKDKRNGDYAAQRISHWGAV